MRVRLSIELESYLSASVLVSLLTKFHGYLILKSNGQCYYTSVRLRAPVRTTPPNTSRITPKKMSFIARRLSQRGRTDVMHAATMSHKTQTMIQPLKKLRENT